ncbi:hypothetical protein [Brucella tritici]|uniref:hypothetical protein n=1 Tax=Brucella tritici TaxID=94626 RepID=UPI001AD7698D|nr:hypothetical protein [Brucella tritici]
MSKIIMIEVDLAKNVFQLHAALMTGELVFRKKLSRQNFQKFMANVNGGLKTGHGAEQKSASLAPA